MPNDIIEMHSTWINVNSIVGCTNGCKYCFLQSTGDNLTKPRIKVSASDAINLLFASKYYDEEIPVCLLANTDPFLNNTNIDYLREMLNLLLVRKVKNPIILITKCLIPDDFIEYLVKLKKEKIKVIIYLSLSGLGKRYEPNINHDDIKVDMAKLKLSDIPFIHYYRPFLPSNSKKEDIKKMLDFVSNYTNVSVITGLSLKSDFINKIDFWDITKKDPVECLKANSIWPEEAYNYFFKEYDHKQLVFNTNLCALANKLHKPSPYYETHECKNYNHCTPEQRKLCAMYKRNDKKAILSEIPFLLKKIGKYDKDLEIIDKGNSLVLKNVNLSAGDCAYLTFMLHYKVGIQRKLVDDHYFNSSLTNSSNFVVKEVSHE